MKRKRFSLARCWQERIYLKTQLFREQKLALLRIMKEAARRSQKILDASRPKRDWLRKLFESKP